MVLAKKTEAARKYRRGRIIGNVLALNPSIADVVFSFCKRESNGPEISTHAPAKNTVVRKFTLLGG